MGKAWVIRAGCLAACDASASSGCMSGADALDSGSQRSEKGLEKEAGSVLLTGAEHAEEFFPGRIGAEIIEQLPHAAMPFAEPAGEAVLGVVVLPPAGGRAADAPRFAFALSSARLVFVDASGTCAVLLDGLALEAAAVETPAGVLCALLRSLLYEHPEMLSRVRGDFETFEQRILEGRERIDRAKMMADSRRMLGLDSFYQGLSDIADLLAGEESTLLPPADRSRFTMLSRQLDRLSARLESLQNYALQVSGLYQEGIDIRQNNVMQWLTVVTTIAMPLTVVTGWYGMNFPHMGLIDAVWGYPLVTCVCIAIVVAEVSFFHRRGWLSFGGRRRRRR